MAAKDRKDRKIAKAGRKGWQPTWVPWSSAAPKGVKIPGNGSCVPPLLGERAGVRASVSS